MTKYKFLQLLLLGLVAFHFLVIIGNLAAFFILPFEVKWYISLPIMSFIARLALTTQPCPLTNFENKLRKKLGKPKISTFVAHYILRKKRGKNGTKMEHR